MLMPAPYVVTSAGYTFVPGSGTVISVGNIYSLYGYVSGGVGTKSSDQLVQCVETSEYPVVSRIESSGYYGNRIVLGYSYYVADYEAKNAALIEWLNTNGTYTRAKATLAGAYEISSISAASSSYFPVLITGTDVYTFGGSQVGGTRTIQLTA